MSNFYTSEHQQKNLTAHLNDPCWGGNTNYLFSILGNKYPDPLDFFIKLIKPVSILDYGCGKGHVLTRIKSKFPDIEMINYDPFSPGYSVPPSKPCDLVVCYNVLQVVEPEFLKSVVDHIYKLTNKNILLSINCASSPEYGNTAEWWKNFLKNYNIVKEFYSHGISQSAYKYDIDGTLGFSGMCQFWIIKDSK